MAVAFDAEVGDEVYGRDGLFAEGMGGREGDAEDGGDGGDALGRSV